MFGRGVKQRLDVCFMVQSCCSAERKGAQGGGVGGAHVYQRALASMTNPLLITQGLYHHTGWYDCDVIYLLFTYIH